MANDFETANIEYIEFWMMDPFAYTGSDRSYGGELYIDLGEVSEDVLRDGKKFYESGMPVDGSSSFTTTQWGKIPTTSTVTYAFATTSGSRARQDVGYNGLTDEEERSYGDYQTFLQNIQGAVSDSAYQAMTADPANDNYHYFRGSDFDQREASILERYKRINMPQGNSPDSDSRTESYDTSYKTTPDVEDINQDYTLNEYEKYFHYHVSVHPGDTILGQNFIVDKSIGRPNLRNGKQGYVTWYQYRIPLNVDPTMIANNLVPENPTHPGEVLKEELESRNITQKSFADKTGLSRSVVSDVLNGRRGVNTEYALLFEAILGIDAELWLRMQARYDMAKVKRNKSFMERLENIRKVAAAF